MVESRVHRLSSLLSCLFPSGVGVAPPHSPGLGFSDIFPTVPVPTCMLDADCGFLPLASTYMIGQPGPPVQAPFLCRAELRAGSPGPAVHFLTTQQFNGDVTAVNVSRCVQIMEKNIPVEDKGLKAIVLVL